MILKINLKEGDPPQFQLGCCSRLTECNAREDCPACLDPDGYKREDCPGIKIMHSLDLESFKKDIIKRAEKRRSKKD